MDDDDDDEGLGGLYEDGTWEWNETLGCLAFKRDFSGSESFSATPTAIIGSMGFKEDLDLIEQQRFRKRFQRKTSDEDVVTLQDIKDLVMYTAPKALMTVPIVNVLHLPMTERFIRALIAYCQYYLQISDEMSRRILELQVKIRTQTSEEIEEQYRENLEDLRLLVAKEYCAIIIGASEFSKYHHMGTMKKSRSLSKMEAILFESILCISTQIVWLALGRKSYNQLGIEIHRIFKSDIYNIIEHQLKVKEREKCDPIELNILFGHCVKQGRMCNSYSPLMNEVKCAKHIDYRLMGLGVIKYDHLNSRLRFFERVLNMPEEHLKLAGMTIGILGMPRAGFDTMLREIKITNAASTSNVSVKSQSKLAAARTSRISQGSTKGTFIPAPLYEDINIPGKEEETELLPGEFPSCSLHQKSINEEQRRKWLKHVNRLTHKKLSLKGKKTVPSSSKS